MTQGSQYEVEQPKELEERGYPVGSWRNEDPPGARRITGDAEKTLSPKNPSFLVSMSCLNLRRRPKLIPKVALGTNIR
ncbi:hypothetical protein Tco_1465898 [Tanacetum coccineum]